MKVVVHVYNEYTGTVLVIA